MTYKEHYYEFWIPILKRQYFKYMLTNDQKAIEELKSNILKNWNLTDEEKEEILNKVRGKKWK